MRRRDEERSNDPPNSDPPTKREQLVERVRPLGELKIRAGRALIVPELVWATRNGSSPTALHHMADEMGGDSKLSRSARWAGVLCRDHGAEAFESAVAFANSHCLDNLGQEEDGLGIPQFACLSARHKQEEWTRWIECNRLHRARITFGVLEFIEILYDWCDDGHRDDYSTWGLAEFEQAAHKWFDQHIDRASDWELMFMLELAQRTDVLEPDPFANVVWCLQNRMPEVDLCVRALTEPVVLFEQEAWRLLREYADAEEIGWDQWNAILEQVARSTDLMEVYGIQQEAKALLAQRLGISVEEVNGE